MCLEICVSDHDTTIGILFDYDLYVYPVYYYNCSARHTECFVISNLEYLKPTVAASNVLPRSTVEFNKILGEYEEGTWIADDGFSGWICHP